MTDYVIPSFEQFQQLREQRRAERQREEPINVAAKPDERDCCPSHGTTTRTSDPTKPLQMYLSQLISPENETIERARSNDGEEESAIHFFEGRHNLRPVFGEQPDAKMSVKIQQVGVGSHNDDDDFTRTPVHKRKRPPLTATSPDESTLSSPPFEARTTERTTLPTPDTSNEGRVAVLEIAGLAKTGLSLLPTGTRARCPADEDNPDHHQQLRGRRRQPWFQKRKKAKMKQMKLSFSSSS